MGGPKSVNTFFAYFSLYIHQVEATTGKQAVVIKGNGLFSRVTECTEITARPDLTGICAIIS